MSWIGKILKGGDIFPESERKTLEALEAKCEPYKKILARINDEWVEALHRHGRIEALANQLAGDPTNDVIFQKMTVAACMPTDLRTGRNHLDFAEKPICERIDRIMAPERDFVRKVLQRALSLAESELRKIEKAEQKTAQEEGFEYIPSGKVASLQNEILGLRGAIKEPYPGEENFYRHPGNWRERLKNYL